MHKQLVRYERGRFLLVDPVRLKRAAIRMRDQILQKVNRDNDPYEFYTRTLPLAEAAIRGEIIDAVQKENQRFVVKGNFHHDESEGFLPPIYDGDFSDAVAGFEVSIFGIPLHQTVEVRVDGVSHAWTEFEDEGDLPG